MVYAALFSTGFYIYGQLMEGSIAAVIAVVGGIIIIRSWKKLG
jgi:hypothetical protein